MTTMHSGCVHRGLRYSAYLRDLSPKAYVAIIRNDNGVDHSLSSQRIRQRVRTKFLGITLSEKVQSLTQIVDTATALIREWDAVDFCADEVK